jgi:competence protein ComEA
LGDLPDSHLNRSFEQESTMTSPWIRAAFAAGVLSLAAVLPTAVAADSPRPSTPAAKASAPVDLNTAPADVLEDLPGVGEVTAKKIIAGRPYKSIDELSKAGLSAAKIAKLGPLVTIGGKPAAKPTEKPAAEKPAAEKPVAGKPPAGGGTPAPKNADAPAPGKKVDVNTATADELEELSGVGEATSAKIIANRPYAKAEDLSKAGLTPARIAKIEALVMFGKPAGPAAVTPPATKPAAAGKPPVAKPPVTPAATPEAKPTKPEAPAAGGKVDLNTADEAQLETLPGVGPVTAKKIIAGRPYAKVEDLAKAGISAGVVAKFADQVTVTPAKSTAADPKAPAGENNPGAEKARTPPAKGMVWVNTDSGIYFLEGEQWYGKTKEGKFMTVEDAKKAGFRESK